MFTLRHFFKTDVNPITTKLCWIYNSRVKTELQNRVTHYDVTNRVILGNINFGNLDV